MKMRFPRASAVPISTAATSETVGLYRTLIDGGRKTSCLTGTSDHFADMGETPRFFETQEAFFQVSGGRRPAIICYEWHDPQWTSRYGSAGAELMRQKVIDANAAGQIVAIHNTGLGNPVTGQLSREGQTYPFPGGVYDGTGYVYDLTGSAVTACLPGGSRNAQYLAYLDRVAAWMDSIRDAQGKLIPVFFRWLHECNGGWFWWAAEGAAKYVDLWRYTVEYMRDTKQCANLLYTWNCDAISSFSAWYPGDAWVDVVSIDYYDNVASPVFGFDARYAELTALTANRPFVLGEYGAALHRNRPQYWEEARIKLTTDYTKFAAAILWRSPWGPAVDDPPDTVAAFSGLMRDQRMLTR